MSLQQQFDQLNKSIATERLTNEIDRANIRPELKSAAFDLLLARGAGQVLTVGEWTGVVDDFLASETGQIFKGGNSADRVEDMTIDQMFELAIEGR